MARSKKKLFRADKAVKAAAREKIGSPQPTRVVPDKKKKQAREKHKANMNQLIEQE